MVTFFLLQKLQSIDENRINKIKSYIKQSADIERNIIPIINTCIDGMVKASDSINPEEVCITLIVRDDPELDLDRI